jgi:hypothetical protein
LLITFCIIDSEMNTSHTYRLPLGNPAESNDADANAEADDEGDHGSDEGDEGDELQGDEGNHDSDGYPHKRRKQ